VRLDRHLRSFMKGATGAGTSAGGELLPTPAEVKARAVKTLKRVLLLQLVWFGCFLAGGVLVLQTAWHNSHLSVSCNGLRGAAVVSTSGCEHHSYLWPLLLMLLGIAGLLVTGYVATRLAVKYLGAGAVAFLRGGRSYMGPMGPRPGGQDTSGGFPRTSGGAPPGLDAGPPPGPPGSAPGAPFS